MSLIQKKYHNKGDLNELPQEDIPCPADDPVLCASNSKANHCAERLLVRQPTEGSPGIVPPELPKSGGKDPHEDARHESASKLFLVKKL